MILANDNIPRLSKRLRQLISSADLFFANVEAPLIDKPLSARAKYRFFDYCMPTDFLGGIMQQTALPSDRWVLSNANNHSGDRGSNQLTESFSILERLGVRAVGRTRLGTPPLIVVELKGIRIGIASWTRWMNVDCFPASEGVLRESALASFDWLKLKELYEIDFLVGMPHWDYEFQHFPHPETQRSARRALTHLGFDLLCGSHPHTLQPPERFGGKFCVYSLGNFCGIGPAWSVKIIPLIKITLGRTAIGDVEIADYRFYFFHQSHAAGKITIDSMRVLPDEKRSRIENRINSLFYAPGFV